MDRGRFSAGRQMTKSQEVRLALFAAIDRKGLIGDRARWAKYTIDLILPNIMKIIADEVRKTKAVDSTAKEE